MSCYTLHLFTQKCPWKPCILSRGPEKGFLQIKTHELLFPTVNAVTASDVIRLIPRYLLGPILAPPLGCYGKIKAELAKMESIINPILEERRRGKETALRLGKPMTYNKDAMEWMKQTAKGRPYD